MKDFKVYQASGYLTKLVTDASDVRKEYEEISGSLVQFDTPISAPLASLIVDINPVQDLHGQDAPYPAGGGVNKLNVADLVAYSAATYGLTTSFDGDWIVISGTYTSSSSSANLRIANLQDSVEFPATNFVAFPDTASANNIVSNAFGLADGNRTLTIYLRNMVQNQSYNLKTKIVCYDGGTAPTEWSPYSNICPITGWTGCEVNRTGMNVWDEEWELGGIINASGQPYSTSDRIRSKNFCSCKPNTSYYGKNTILNGNIYWYRRDKSYISYESNVNRVINSPSEAYYFKIVIGSITEYNHQFSLNYPSTDTDYHAYSGTTLSVTFPDTVYGGKYDFVSGSGNNELDSFVFDGEYGSGKAATDITVGQYGDENYAHFIIYEKNPNTYETSQAILIPKVKCNMFKYKFANNDGTAHWYKSTFINVFIPTSIASTLNEFIAFLSNTPLQVVIPLITPTEIQLTPQEINTLIGVNNIWADTGDVSVKYRTH